MTRNGKENDLDPGTISGLLRVAWPLILTNSFMALQITIDRVFLSQYNPDALSASLASTLVFLVPLSFFQGLIGYASTFVAQYYGAQKEDRLGPVIWQAIYLACGAGLLFLFLVPFAEFFLRQGGHKAHLVELEVTFFQCLCCSALPTLLVGATTSFFSGRGESWIVLLIDGVGLIVNSILAYLLIFGFSGLAPLGIFGAGLANVIGSSFSAILGLFLFFQARYRQRFQTIQGWRPDSALVHRMIRFGGPNGVLLALDSLSWSLFLWVVGWIGENDFAATSIALTLNCLVYFPGIGLAQGVGVLVGQHLGENRPDLAEKTTWQGLWICLGATFLIGMIYLLIPGILADLFQGRHAMDLSSRGVRESVKVLLRFVVVYCLFDAMNLVFSFALRGAGDTRFVTLVNLFLSWPVMVFPTWICWYWGLGVYWIWFWVTLYIVILSLVFLLRFRWGAWRLMRVIEST